MIFNKVSLACLILSGSALLSACGGSSGDSGSPPPIASSNLSAEITPQTGTALVNSVLDKSFEFSSGVPGFGTTSATSLKLSGNGAAPSFDINSAEGSASGTMNFGSCIFTVAKSNFAATSPLAQGKTLTIKPCSLIVATVGIKGNGIAVPTTLTLLLGTINSKPISISVSISATGVVTVNSFTIGSVTLVAATGATGATGAGG